MAESVELRLPVRKIKSGYVAGGLGLLELYNLAKFTVIFKWVLTCDPDSAQSSQFYSAAPLGDQKNSTMTQSHYLDHEPTSPCPIILMPMALLGCNKCHI